MFPSNKCSRLDGTLSVTSACVSCLNTSVKHSPSPSSPGGPPWFGGWPWPGTPQNWTRGEARLAGAASKDCAALLDCTQSKGEEISPFNYSILRAVTIGCSYRTHSSNTLLPPRLSSSIQKCLSSSSSTPDSLASHWLWYRASLVLKVGVGARFWSSTTEILRPCRNWPVKKMHKGPHTQNLHILGCFKTHHAVKVIRTSGNTLIMLLKEKIKRSSLKK